MLREMKHTEGEWKYYKHPNQHYDIRVGSIHVARCISEVDAKLIAAAPELLEILNEFIACSHINKIGQVTINTQSHINAMQLANEVIQKLAE